MKFSQQGALMLFLFIVLGMWSAESTVLRKKVVAEQPSANDAVEDDATNSRDDDDDDEDEDDSQSSTSGSSSLALPQVSAQAPAPQPSPAVVLPASPASAPQVSDPCAVLHDKADVKICQLKRKLVKNKEAQKQLQQNLLEVSNETSANAEIAEQAKKVANETESKALASTLAHMWKEMRMFDLPSYTDHVKDEIEDLKKEENKLNKKMKKATGEEKEDKDDASEDDEKKEKEEKNEENLVGAQYLKTGNDQVDKAATESGYRNFWVLNSDKKEEFLLYTLVEVIGALLFAFLFYKLRQTYPKRFSAEARPDVQRNGKDFSFGLFSCFEAPNIAVLGCCCPIMTWASTLDNQGFLKFFQAFLAMLLLITLNAYTYGISSIVALGLGIHYRQKLRKAYTIENGTPKTLCFDCLAWTFCSACAICQEAREESAGQGGDAP